MNILSRFCKRRATEKPCHEGLGKDQQTRDLEDFASWPPWSFNDEVARRCQYIPKARAGWHLRRIMRDWQAIYASICRAQDTVDRDSTAYHEDSMILIHLSACMDELEMAARALGLYVPALSSSMPREEVSPATSAPTHSATIGELVGQR